MDDERSEVEKPVVTRAAVKLGALARSDVNNLGALLGTTDPVAKTYYFTVAQAAEKQATKVVNTLLTRIVKEYVDRARPLLVAQLLEELYQNVLFEVDERGPYVRLEAYPTMPETKKDE